MHKPNYNYNYNYEVSPSIIQRPSSNKKYYPAQKHQLEKQSNFTHAQHLPVQYYPITDQQRPLSSKNSYTGSVDYKSSFLVDNRKQKQQFERTNLSFLSAQSPKSLQNWHKNSQNLKTQTNYHNAAKKWPQPTQKYINWLYNSFNQFQKTGNAQILKSINDQNSKQTIKLFEDLYSQKKNSITTIDFQRDSKQKGSLLNVNSEKMIKLPKQKQKSSNKTEIQKQVQGLQQERLSLLRQISRQRQTRLELQKQIQQEIQIKQGRNLHGSRVREQNHLKQMQESIVQLEDQIRALERKNNQLMKGVSTLPFFKEWNLMFEQAKGATKLNIKLKQEIQKREELVKELTNQDPSNNSQAKSVRRNPSENGQKLANFKKENKLQIFQNLRADKNVSKPLSQAPHKFTEKLQSGRSNDGIIRHLSHSNRLSESKKTATVNSSIEKPKQRKQSYDQKPQNEIVDWKGVSFQQNLKNLGLKLMGNQSK